MKYFDLLTSKNLKKNYNLPFFEQIFLKYIKSISKLPSEYQEVEYIESTGTQYIDTDYIPNYETKYDLTILIKELGNSLRYIISANDTNSRNNIYINANNKYSAGYGSSYKVTSNDININSKIKIKLDKNLFYVNNELLWSFSEEEFENTVNTILFARNNNSEITSYISMRLYKCKIYEDDILVRDLIPCYRKNDNEIGLYDLVEETFYSNDGTGVFLKGDNI